MPLSPATSHSAGRKLAIVLSDLTADHLLVKLNPLDPAGYLQQGDCLIRLKRDESALAAYRKAVLLSPKSAPVWRMYGAALLAANKLAQARSAIRRAIRSPTDSSPPKLIFSSGDTSPATAE
jgi:predicted Zn-dependent protease